MRIQGKFQPVKRCQKLLGPDWVIIPVHCCPTFLVGGLVAIFYVPIYWESHHPNWLSYFSEGWPNHQPVLIVIQLFLGASWGIPCGDKSLRLQPLQELAGRCWSYKTLGTKRDSNPATKREFWHETQTVEFTLWRTDILDHFFKQVDHQSNWAIVCSELHRISGGYQTFSVFHGISVSTPSIFPHPTAPSCGPKLPPGQFWWAVASQPHQGRAQTKQGRRKSNLARLARWKRFYAGKTIINHPPVITITNVHIGLITPRIIKIVHHRIMIVQPHHNKDCHTGSGACCFFRIFLICFLLVFFNCVCVFFLYSCCVLIFESGLKI